MNADLHMASDLKKTGKGILFVIFGVPDIEILTTLKAEINEDAGATLHSDTSRPMNRASSGVSR